MFQTLMISASGMSAQQAALDVVANNLANVNTTGFKSSQAKFSDLFSQAVAQPEGTPSPGQGLGVKNEQVETQYSQGDLQSTNNPLDIAIQGDGFFQVTLPDGTLGYTRDGSLKLNGDGILGTAQGYPLYPEIQVPGDAGSIVLGTDGTVSAVRAQDGVSKPIGQLELARFVNPGGLEKQGQNLLVATQASGEAQVNTPGKDGLGTVVQGSVERSNVNMVQEMVNLILAQRAYEINTKAIQTTDDMLRMGNNLRRA